jgi:hypothetical protein
MGLAMLACGPLAGFETRAGTEVDWCLTEMERVVAKRDEGERMGSAKVDGCTATDVGNADEGCGRDGDEMLDCCARFKMRPVLVPLLA